MTIPIPEFVMVMPERLLNSKRSDNKILKECMDDELVHHHRKRLPGHFNRTATQKYGYAKRVSRYRRANDKTGSGRRKTMSYDAWKREKFGSNTDLIKTGASKRRILSMRRVIVAGNVDSGIRGRLQVEFDFKGGKTGRRKETNQRQGVTPDVMIAEVQRFTDDELREISQSYAAKYVHKVNTDTSPRMRIKV